MTKKRPAGTEFQEWMQALKDRLGTRQAIADALGVSLSAVGAGVDERNTFSVETLLELARIAGEPPDYVLRLAGKDHVADLIHDLYGLDPNRPVPADEKWFSLYRLCSVEERDIIRKTLARFARSHAPPAEPPGVDPPRTPPAAPDPADSTRDRRTRRSPRP